MRIESRGTARTRLVGGNRLLFLAFVSIAACASDSPRASSADGGAGGASGHGSPDSQDDGGGIGEGPADGANRFVIGEGGKTDGFGVHIERDHRDVTSIALGCGGCADIDAVATGGYAPYTFRWEDGSTNPTRHVCPASTTTYEVTVTDAGTASGEFPRGPETTRATLTAVAPGCAPDAGAGLCIANPGLEGKAAIYELGGFTAPPWERCDMPGTPDIRNVDVGWTVPGPNPTEGATYLEILWLAQVWRETVGAPLCASLVKGRSYSFTIDVTYYDGTVEGVPPGRLNVFASNALCGEDQLLWTSPNVGLSWHTHCVTFTAGDNYRYLKLSPADQQTGVLVDNLVPVAACPP